MITKLCRAVLSLLVRRPDPPSPQPASGPTKLTLPAAPLQPLTHPRSCVIPGCRAWGPTHGLCPLHAACFPAWMIQQQVFDHGEALLFKARSLDVMKFAVRAPNQ